jgi:hypothetical protein
MRKNASFLALTGLMSVSLLAIPGHAQSQDKPVVKIPDAGVPEVMTMEGSYVRAAYNREGYAILGYHIVNMSVGEEWMLLDFGVTLREGVKDYTLTRDALSLETPDGKTLPLPSVEQYRSARLQALEARARVSRDSINYFPPTASRPCRIGFFNELSAPVLPWDEVELSSTRACLGRLYFQVPGGIAYGQHWLNVKFEKSLVRVPFRVMTKEEEKILSKNYKDISKQVKEAFKPKKTS